MKAYRIAPSGEHRGETFLIVETDDDGAEHEGETRFASMAAAQAAIDRLVERGEEDDTSPSLILGGTSRTPDPALPEC